MISLLKLVIFFAVVIEGFVLSMRPTVTEDRYGEKHTNLSVARGWLFATIVALLAMVILFPSIGIIQSGSTGVVLRFGAVTHRTLGEGVYLVTPIAETVEVMSTQVHAHSAHASAASRDMQAVGTKVTLNYQLMPSRCGEIYRTLRRDYVTRVIVPAEQESVKAATAQYDAESLIAKREAVRQTIIDLCKAKLEKPYGIQVHDVSITDFAFSDDFNRAIEMKAKAIQEAETARRNLEKVKAEAEQKIANARAEAESLRLQRAQITPEMLQLRWIEKWDGTMPQYVAGPNGMTMMQMPANK
jgi:regulator of protease activity HflC (stomatin/prohibitin superfamily)